MFVLSICRVSSAAYSRIYQAPTDGVDKASQYKEAPIKDTNEILIDDETKRLRENQGTLIKIPVEVCNQTKSPRLHCSKFKDF